MEAPLPIDLQTLSSVWTFNDIQLLIFSVLGQYKAWQDKAGGYRHKAYLVGINLSFHGMGVQFVFSGSVWLLVACIGTHVVKA